MHDRIVGVSRADLAAALKEWDEEAKAKGFERRTDAERFVDSANYVMDKVEAIVARRHAD